MRTVWLGPPLGARVRYSRRRATTSREWRHSTCSVASTTTHVAPRCTHMTREPGAMLDSEKRSKSVSWYLPAHASTCHDPWVRNSLPKWHGHDGYDARSSSARACKPTSTPCVHMPASPLLEAAHAACMHTCTAVVLQACMHVCAPAADGLIAAGLLVERCACGLLRHEPLHLMALHATHTHTHRACGRGPCMHCTSGGGKARVQARHTDGGGEGEAHGAEYTAPSA